MLPLEPSLVLPTRLKAVETELEMIELSSREETGSDPAFRARLDRLSLELEGLRVRYRGLEDGNDFARGGEGHLRHVQALCCYVTARLEARTGDHESALRLLAICDQLRDGASSQVEQP